MADGSVIAAGLEHPHSLLPLSEKLAACASRHQELVVLGPGLARNRKLDGYTRGLCLDGPDLFVGTSVGRRVSRSSGRVDNPADPGTTVGRCAVTQLSASDLAVKRTFDLGAYGDEIYDLVPVTAVAQWPTLAPGELVQSFGAGASPRTQ